MARSNTRNSNKNRETKAPAYVAFHVAEKNDRNAFWTRIGAAWDHEDGKGLTLQLDLVAVSGGRIVLRTPSETTEERGA